ncbi:MAG: hypothetical protein DRI86_03735 [Bacteroidetes bacterium]|nr:MAG: hypothetical protein DRI86_03735 [Bacteroidota bacterium]
MRRDLAESFSLSFHPLFIPFYSLLFVFVLPIFEVQTLGPKFQVSLAAMVGLMTIGLPLFSMRMLKKHGIINSYFLKTKEERFIPYFLTATYFAITTYMLFRIDFIPIVIPLLFAIPTLVSAALLLFNFKLKVSTHAAGMGGLNATILVINYFYDLHLEVPMTIIMALTIIVIISRYFLKAHNWTELLIGYFTGLILGLTMGVYFLYPMLN